MIPGPAAVTAPFAVTIELLALIPVPPPLAVTGAFVVSVTLALFVAVTAVPKPVVTGLLTVQGKPPL
jgi:hypothetical protein